MRHRTPSTAAGADPDTHVPDERHGLDDGELGVHGVPLNRIRAGHKPVPALHVPAVLHWSPPVHTTGFEPVHTPPWQL